MLNPLATETATAIRVGSILAHAGAVERWLKEVESVCKLELADCYRRICRTYRKQTQQIR